MKKIVTILLIVLLCGCENNSMSEFNITNQISNYCYHPRLYFNDGSEYAIKNNISSLGMTSENITTKADRFKFMFTNRDNQTYINVDWVDVSSDNVIIGSHMKFKRYE